MTTTIGARMIPDDPIAALANEIASAIAYANRRHRETNRAYIVTAQGHALMDCAENRYSATFLGGVVFVSSIGANI